MIGALTFNESYYDYLASFIPPPNATNQYTTDTPNRFKESYKSLNGEAEDAIPAKIFIRILK